MATKKLSLTAWVAKLPEQSGYLEAGAARIDALREELKAGAATLAAMEAEVLASVKQCWTRAEVAAAKRAALAETDAQRSAARLEKARFDEDHR